MITYELAKQLKEAGFPLKKLELSMRGSTNYGNLQTIKIDKEWYILPTLSDLIEACGSNFKGILFDSPLGQGILTKWLAIMDIGFIEPIEPDSTSTSKALWRNWYVFGGSTPEEAVIHLWIELNKK